MENDMDNTVDNTQDDNNAIKSMRERIKELEGVEKEYKSVQMGNAIKDAGFDPSSGQGKALKDLYKGELDSESIKQFASENYGWGASPEQVTEQEAQRSRVVTSQDNLDTVIEASIPVGRLGSSEEIAHAVWYLATPGASFTTGATFDINGGQWIG